MKHSEHISPPRWATKFLHFYCPDVLLEEIEGDLWEAFQGNYQELGRKRAQFHYVVDTLRFCNPTTFQKARRLSEHQPHTFFTQLAMLNHYLLIIWRNIRRQPFYALLNLSGLTLGIAAVLFILLYLDFELNFDRFHEKKDQVYRIYTPSLETHEKRMDVDWDFAPGNLGPLAKQEYPEITAFTRFYDFYNTNLVAFNFEDQRIPQTEGVWATDSSTLSMFTFDWIAGGGIHALSAPNQVVLSQSLARRIFGNQDAMGKILSTDLVTDQARVDDQFDLMVTGVFQDLPPNSHLDMEALISATTDPQVNEHYFNRFGFRTYLLLPENVSPEALEPKLSAIYDKHLDIEREPVLVRANHELVPLSQVHLRDTGGLSYLYILGGVGLLLLLIISISYVNLATAQASRRALEVGLRKVLGSPRRSLVVQFLTESLFFTTVAVVLGVALVWVGIQPLNQMLDLQLYSAQLNTPQWGLGIGSILILLGILGGSYPAFFLSAFQPITVLKGKLAHRSNRTTMRKVLLSVQFAIVMFVLVCTSMIYRQLQFIRQKDLGFEQEHVVRLPLTGQNDAEQILRFKQALLESPYIHALANASFTPGQGMGRCPIAVETPEGPIQQFVGFGYIDEGFLETMDIALTRGRNYSPEFSTDTLSSIIVNETLLRNFGVTDPIGTKIRRGNQGNPHFYQIIGVIEDFHQTSLHSPIESQIFFLDVAPQLLVRVGTDIPKALDHAQQTWEHIFPQTPFQYTFLSDAWQNIYEADRIRGKIFLSFSLLTLFICFLGLFGLTAYLSNQRIKEIGIRKILGARISDIVALISKEFVWLIGIAVIPAFVGAWYVIRQWLENFAFQAEMNYFLFAGVLGLILVLTLMVTGVHAVRTAQLNPAGSLRQE